MILLGSGVFFLSVMTILCCPPSATLMGHNIITTSHRFIVAVSPAEIHVEEGLALVAPLGDLDYLRRVRPHAQLRPGEDQLPVNVNLVTVFGTGIKND